MNDRLAFIRRMLRPVLRVPAAALKYDCEACASFRVACGDPQARCPEHPA